MTQQQKVYFPVSSTHTQLYDAYIRANQSKLDRMTMLEARRDPVSGHSVKNILSRRAHWEGGSAAF